eukprot:PITA_31033
MKMKSMIHFRFEFCVAVALFASPSFSQTGFISLDCGGAKSYNDTAGIQWITDDGYIDIGEKSIVPNVAGVTTSIQMNSLRKFPERNKNCYDITPLKIGTKYLLRATFLYANYDGLASPPTFVLMLDADVWITVTLTESDVMAKELIFMAKFNSSSVCLGRQSNGGVPIISSLELRPLEETMYWPVSQDYSLFRLENTNFGAPNDSSDIRYPDDPFDRLWSPSANTSGLPNIITNEKVSTGAAKDMPPSLVMQTADRSPRNYVFPYRKSSRDGNLYISMYFAELQALNDTSIREFDLYLDNNKLGGTIQPRYLESSNVSVLMPYGITTQMAFRVQATNRSTLPPIFNALEIYRQSDLRQNGTFAQDVRALREIQLDINFTYASAGDPCLPANFSWDWLGCNSDVSPRITSLNLSSKGITSIPSTITHLTALVIMLSGNPLLCEGDANQCTKSKPGISKRVIISLSVAGGIILILLSITAATLLGRRLKRGRARAVGRNPLKEPMARGHDLSSPQCRKFSYNEVKEITRGFGRQIGRGGFGPVFYGRLQNVLELAVKVLSESSKQGDKEFSTEVTMLSKVHHKNLVPFVGYCCEGENQILIYQYMSKGNLRGILHGPNALEQLADWKTRLDIALNAAQGLEYLHNGCKPIIIHRDIKATNILLSERMEAKLSDFGLSRFGPSSEATHVSTDVKGTFGYLDPEYYTFPIQFFFSIVSFNLSGTENQRENGFIDIHRAAALNRYATTRNLTEKSDVYSFGVVIFEIISGKEPVDTNVSGENSHIVSWGRSMIGEGNIEGILDKRAVREVNMSAMWKVAELAMLCTESQPNERPTMNEVVSELKESIRLLNKTDLLDRKLVHHPTFSAAGSSISTTKPSAR